MAGAHLGVRAVNDHAAQMVVERVIEPALEVRFPPNSYGYRPAIAEALVHALRRKLLAGLARRLRHFLIVDDGAAFGG